MLALAIIIAVLALILLIPVGVDAGYMQEKAAVSVKIGPARLQLLPPKPKKQTKKSASKKTGQKPAAAELDKKEKKPSPKLTKQDIVEIARLGLRTLSRLRRSLSVDTLLLHITAAAEDPYDAVVTYNRIVAVLGSLSPLVHRAFRIKNEDVGVQMDFTATKMSFEAHFAASFRIGQLLRIALCAGAGFLTWLSHRKKMAKNDENPTADAACAQKGC